MVRKLAAAMLSAGVLIPGLANALGLGEIKLNSALSEPLDAEIELVQVRELTPSEIIPSLADSSDFESAQVERFHFLTDLRFEVEMGTTGRPYIRVRSRKPVKEPFLNFLVEVNWPAGRLLREYTLLLDPPLYRQQSKADVSQPVSTAAPTPAATEKSAPESVDTEFTTNSADPELATDSGLPETSGVDERAGETYVIQPNDSLWAIAERFKPSEEVSVQQTMMAMQRSNPEAFMENNINLLVKGEVLRAPTEAETLQLTSREAIALAAEQNRRWREKVAAIQAGKPAQQRQLNLSGDDDSGGGGSTGTEDARLKLVSAQIGESSETGQGGEGGSGQLRDQLAVAEENIDKLKLENEDLSLKVNDLEAQLDTSEKVLSLKDEQIAALQARLKELEQAASDEEAIAVADEPSDTAVDYNFEEEAAQNEVTGDAELPSDIEMPADEQPEPEIATVEPVVVEPSTEASTEPKQPTSMISQWLSNPLYLAMGAGAVLLLALGALFARRKSEHDESYEESNESLDLPPLEDSSEPLDQFESVDLEEDDAFEEAVEASVDEKTVPQTTDVIGEADIYIAYGRFPQALELLEKAAENEPDRSDIRLKICEVCAESNQPETFNDHYNQLIMLGDSVAISQAEEMRNRLDFSDVGFGSQSDAEFDSDLLDTDREEASESTNVATPVEAPTLDDAPDFDKALEFDLSSESNSAESDLDLDQESDTGLEFDLGDLEDTGSDFSSDATVTDAPELPEATEEFGSRESAQASGLDFDLELDSEDNASLSPGEQRDAEPTDETDFAALDFDSPTDLEFDAPQEEESSTPEINADSASKLADELDLDLDSDFLGETTEQDNILSEDVAETSEPNIESITDLDSEHLAPAANDFDSGEDELDFLSEADESSTKLDLARAYIDMGDREGAKDILDEVMVEGNDEQKHEAKDLLVRLET